MKRRREREIDREKRRRGRKDRGFRTGFLPENNVQKVTVASLRMSLCNVSEFCVCLKCV